MARERDRASLTFWLASVRAPAGQLQLAVHDFDEPDGPALRPADQAVLALQRRMCVPSFYLLLSTHALALAARLGLRFLLRSRLIDRVACLGARARGLAALVHVPCVPWPRAFSCCPCALPVSTDAASSLTWNYPNSATSWERGTAQSVDWSSTGNITSGEPACCVLCCRDVCLARVGVSCMLAFALRDVVVGCSKARVLQQPPAMRRSSCSCRCAVDIVDCVGAQCTTLATNYPNAPPFSWNIPAATTISVGLRCLLPLCVLIASLRLPFGVAGTLCAAVRLSSCFSAW